MKTPAQLKALYIKAKEAYYNTEGEEPIMTDAEFDKLEEQVKKHFPKLVAKTGILGKKRPTNLMVPMPSLEKCKAANGNVGKFLARLNKYNSGQHVAMEKLDGSSVQAVYDAKGRLVSLATRGDGEIGQDITFLAPYCRNLPQKVATNRGLIVRMEAILPKDVFVKRYSQEAASARAAVSGALNRTDASLMLVDIHFVALRLMHKGEAVGVGLDLLAQLGFTVVRNTALRKQHHTDEHLSALLLNWKKTSKYEMDGIVIHANDCPIPTNADKPKYAFAYKLDVSNDDAPLTTIRDIVWKKSAFNVLVPKAIVDPVDFDGVTVKAVALHNYAMAKKLGHGIGAEVRIIRSGDIIPKIVKTERRMPMNKPTASFGQYTFDGTNLIAASDKENHKELLVRFFHHTGLDGFGPALAEEMASHEAPTWAVCRMTTIKHWLPFTSGSTKTSAKLAQEVVALRERITLDVAMSASGVFDKGVGSTRIRNLLKSNPRAFDYLTMPYSMAARKFLLTAAQETAGCGPSFAKLLEKGLKAWCDWYKNSKLSIEPPVAQKQVALVTGTKYSGKKFSWTGYRDAAQEAAVTAGGGEVIKLGSKTNVLFYNPNGKFMDKVEAAKAKGVKVVTFDKF